MISLWNVFHVVRPTQIGHPAVVVMPEISPEWSSLQLNLFCENNNDKLNLNKIPSGTLVSKVVDTSLASKIPGIKMSIMVSMCSHLFVIAVQIFAQKVIGTFNITSYRPNWCNLNFFVIFMACFIRIFNKPSVIVAYQYQFASRFLFVQAFVLAEKQKA